ncbi:MobA/MobL family protein, partial [Acidocella sp. KAb 2-4]|uniref:MobA/MobL family protein n=1 Tax=Acidocella sp. KAb 2-4 TaxID=2885158 RepID=UPI001D0718C3
ALWNAAEAAEKRKDAKVAREYEVALPAELSAKGRADLARAFASEIVERYGVAADVAIHAPGKDGDSRNHHAHILTTTRTVGADGLGVKTRQLDQSTTASIEVEQLRDVWGGLTNRALEREGVGERVDHRSLAAQREAAMERSQDQAQPEPERQAAERQAAERQAQDLDREPTVHLGPAAAAIERRGEGSERGDQMRAVQGRNEERRGLWQQVREWGGQALDKARDLGTQLRERLSGADLTLLRNANLRASLARADVSGLREVNKTLEAARAPKQIKPGLDLPGKVLNPLKALTKGQEKQQGQAAPGPKISRDDGQERSRSEERSQQHRSSPAKSRDFGWER